MTASRFYGLSRAMVDYADATTGGVEVYSQIAAHLAAGGQLDDWLALQDHGWPTSTEQLLAEIARFVNQRCDA